MIPGGAYVPLAPLRIMDTRDGTGGQLGPLTGGQTIGLPVAGRNGVPANAAAVVLNVTVTDTTASSYLTVFSAGSQGSSRPLASNLN